MADDPLMSQEEIERLLGQAKDLTAQAVKGPASTAPAPSSGGAPTAPPRDPGKMPNLGGPSAPTPSTKPSGPPSGEGLMQADIEHLLDQAAAALDSVNAPCKNEMPSGVTSFHLEEFSGATASTEAASLDLIRDVELDLKIELGRTHMYLEDVLKLRKGAVVPLDKLAGDPVDIYVNGRLIARGEVLVLNDNFCVRVAELIVGANVFS
ncbi:MAG: flagellar motor switch protein FliN [Thermoguttaceae bacterium]|jgi:flagellar motor switch protein FliN/FliY